MRDGVEWKQWWCSVCDGVVFAWSGASKKVQWVVRVCSCTHQSLSCKQQPLSCKSPRLTRFGLWFERKERPSQFRSPVNRLHVTSQLLQHRRNSHISRSPCTAILLAVALRSHIEAPFDTCTSFARRPAAASLQARLRRQLVNSATEAHDAHQCVPDGKLQYLSLEDVANGQGSIDKYG